MTVVGTQKKLGNHVICVIPGLFADLLKIGSSASSSPIRGVVKMKKAVTQ